MPAKPPKNGLTFNPNNHTYRLDGKPVVGYSSIIGVLDKPAIPKWAAKTVAEYVAENPDAIEQLRTLGDRAMVAALKEVPWKKRDDAGARGSTLHDYAERLLNGEEVDVDEELAPVVEHALAFLDDWQIEPLLIEQPVASREHWYAGTPDLIANYRRPDTGATGTGVFDWKSAKAIYPEISMQLNAYGHAEFYGLNGDERPLPACDSAFGVHIRADGYDVYEAKYGRDVFEEFVAIRRTFEIAKRMRGDWRTPGSGYLSVAIQAQSAA